MKHELVELVVRLLWNCMVVFSNLGLGKIKSFLARFLFGMNVKKQKVRPFDTFNQSTLKRES